MSKELFQHTQEKSVNILRLRLPDTLDAMEFDRLNESVTGLLTNAADGKWVLDLSDVNYMGSAVLGLMVNVRQQVKSARGSLVLCGMSARLHAIFSACCLERLFNIAKDRPAALRAV